MNSYEKIIGRFSFEQKIKLITSLKYMENSQIEDYIVPEVKYELNFTDIIDDFINPSVNALGSLYDDKIIEKYGYELGKCLSYLKKRKIINIPLNTVNINEPSFSSSKLVTAKLASALAKGIEKGGFLASYGVVPELSGIDLNSYLNDILYTFKVALSYYKPFSMVLESPDALDVICSDFEYDGLKVVITRNQNELINSLNHSAELTIASGYFINYHELEEACNEYKRYKKLLADEEISHTEFRNKLIKSEILNPDAIDEALCSLLGKLAHMDNVFNQSNKYDIEALKELDKQVARESVVLLKNEDNILPLKRENKFAFIGDALFSPNLNTNKEYKNDIENLINSYNLDTIGIAHGYINGAEANEDLIVKAQRLIEESEYAVVFLNAVDGRIPENELDLLEHIKDSNATIIPVVLNNRRVDLSPLMEYKALIMVPADSIYNINAAIEIIAGKFNPTGRLPFAIKSIVDDSSFKVDDNLLFPLGYGLSYSKFNYRSITIDENGILLAVTNESKLSGTDMLFFTSKFLGNDNELNYIRDFITVDLEGHESKLVEFKYNFESFSLYDINKSEMLIREGDYLVQLMTSFNNVLSEKEIYLAKLSKRGDTTCDLEESYESANESFDALNYDVKKQKNYLSLPLKIVTLLIIDLYLILLAGYILVMVDKMLPKIILGVVIAFIVFFTVCLIFNIVKRSKIKDKANTFAEMVNSFEDYSVDIHESYSEPKPVAFEEDDDLSEEEEELVEEEKPQIKLNYDAYGSTIEDDLVYSNNDNFEELLDRFIKFSLNNGVMIESIYAKQLLAAVFSSNLVLIHGNTKEKNVELIGILNKFFGNSEDFYMDLENKEAIDIYWSNDEEQDTYSLSRFANNIIRSKYLSKRFNMIAFNNVNNENLGLVNEYIEFAETPKEIHAINIGDDHTIEIASNTVVIFFTDEKLNNKKVYENSISLDLVTSKNVTEHQDIIQKYNDYQYYNSLITQARNRNFLSEDLWRKIDAVFEDKLFEGFDLNNRYLVQSEKLSAVLIEYKFDEVQALNAIFILKLIPIIVLLEENSSPSFRQEVIELLDKIFEDRIESAGKALRNY